MEIVKVVLELVREINFLEVGESFRVIEVF